MIVEPSPVDLALQRHLAHLLPGGVMVASFMAPIDAVFEQWSQRSEKRKAEQGISVRLGKHLMRLMREAGLDRVEASASYDAYGTSERVRALSEAMARGQDKDVLAGDKEAASFAAAWRNWGQSPDAFAAQSYCEAVGWCGNCEPFPCPNIRSNHAR